jgi:peptide deformylase
MVKQIVRDPLFLAQKSEPATEADRQVIEDLTDTLKANSDRCVGMAANMIGYKKRIIIVTAGFMDMILINPVLVSKSGVYETEEGCLSLSGVRKTIRYDQITVRYLDMKFSEHTQTFSGYIAQIIQHECDHLEGILI